MTRRIGGSVDWLIVMILVLGPLQWITLADIGLTLKPVHLPLFLVAGFGVAATLGRRQSIEIDRSCLAAIGPFTVSYLVYLLALYVGCFYAASPAFGLSLVFKLCLQAAIGFGVLLYFVQLSTRRIFDSLLLGSLLSGITFLLVASYTLALRGESLPELVLQAVTTGNPALLQFKLFLTLFNAGDWSGGVRTPASLRQVTMAFFYLSLMISLHRVLVPGSAPKVRMLAWSSAGIALFILLISLSRSLILVSAVGLGLVSLSLIRERAHRLIFGCLAFGLSAFAIFLLRDPSGIIGLVEARFGGLNQDGRLLQYAKSFETIAAAPIWGQGTGHMDEFRVGTTNMVHNLLLGAWVQAGIWAVLAALTFTAALVWMMWERVRIFWRQPALISLVALPILPVIRSQLGGQGGNYTLPEFLAIILFVSLVYRADLSRWQG
jgi:hypothetical protein